MNYPKNGPNIIAKRTPEPASTPKEQAQLDALRDFKKKQALQTVKESRTNSELRQQKLSHREIEFKLNALLDQYTSGKITHQEYYEQREIILRDSGVK
jgi:hypothetical protein